MNLEEFFESELSTRKTVWRKRGDKVTRREITQIASSDIRPKTHIEIKKEHDDAAGS